MMKRLYGALGTAIEWVDHILDSIPSWSPKHGFARYGDWGCALGMWRLWLPLQERADK